MAGSEQADGEQMNILVLGGTGEARKLAERLVALGHQVTTSLAGRTQEPMVPAGQLRIGSLGGAEGLAAFLQASGFDWLIDATHPYAAGMSANAVAAANGAGVPLLRLVRPAWREPPEAPWTHVPDLAAAAAAIPAGAKVLLTTGHGGLEAFLRRQDCRFVVRLIEPPAKPLPPHAEIILSRPPYRLEGELALLEREAITHLVSKNSGGAQTADKLEAARQRRTNVIMVARPAYPPAREVADVEACVAALAS
ncbi:cobalt-precorrin-6A reductase [Devosia sp. 1635]|uniref:cobalt-precorrin-6A reductase n=1 Tax=Devosia sp. 1635 TaxID=2726066 RepID=UPI0020C0B6F1|nr:cobalt-precorrin-6A reductase [Devosia sp. 1635]